MQKNKFEIWVLKTTILDPWKSVFLVFKEKPPKKCFFDSALKTLDGQMSFGRYFQKRTKKSY